MLDLPKQTDENVEFNDHLYRQRLRALQAVDELVDGVFERLEDQDLLKNTYIVYSSDNGYHVGQHRLQPGKSCGYEEDINIPLIVRGLGVAANFSADIVTTHTDLAPTFLEMLGVSSREDLDGRAIPMQRSRLESSSFTRREYANVEYWGFAGGEGKYDRKLLYILRISLLRFVQAPCIRTIRTKPSDCLAQDSMYTTAFGAIMNMSCMTWR